MAGSVCGIDCRGSQDGHIRLEAGSEPQAERSPMTALSRASGMFQSLDLGASLRLGQLVELKQREWNPTPRATAMLSNPPGKYFALASASTSFIRGQSVRVSPDTEFGLRMTLCNAFVVFGYGTYAVIGVPCATTTIILSLCACEGESCLHRIGRWFSCPLLLWTSPCALL